LTAALRIGPADLRGFSRTNKFLLRGWDVARPPYPPLARLSETGLADALCHHLGCGCSELQPASAAMARRRLDLPVIRHGKVSARLINGVFQTDSPQPYKMPHSDFVPLRSG